MCFVWISEPRATFDLSIFNYWIFINESECVYCEVGLGNCIKKFTFCLERLNSLFIQ
jgi:hypothetical protein